MDQSTLIRSCQAAQLTYSYFSWAGLGHVSAGCIFIEPILVIMKIEYHLSQHQGAQAASQTTMLHMERLNQTQSIIFVILCVLCFQRQSFLTLISLLSN